MPSSLFALASALFYGFGDFFGYRRLLAEWRSTGDFDGFELHERRTAS